MLDWGPAKTACLLQKARGGGGEGCHWDAGDMECFSTGGRGCRQGGAVGGGV